MSDLISRTDAIKDVETWTAVDEHERHLQKNVIEWLKEFPPAELGTNLASLGTDGISRQAAIETVMECYDNDELFEVYEEKLRELQPAQPERIKGRWLPWKYAMPGKEYKFHKCSVCGVCDEYITDVPRPNGTIGRLESIRNFCPNCGADMKEVTE